MPPIRIYTITTCGYCHAAVRLLRDKRLAFEQIDVTNKRDMRTWLAQTTGRSTVPQIFIGEQAIGGYTDLAALDDSGELDRMLTP